MSQELVRACILNIENLEKLTAKQSLNCSSIF